jgi:hypothetical protein
MIVSSPLNSPLLGSDGTGANSFFKSLLTSGFSFSFLFSSGSWNTSGCSGASFIVCDEQKPKIHQLFVGKIS